MKISCRVEAFYKDHESKINKNKAIKINDLADVSIYKVSGYEVEFELSIIAHGIDGNIEVLKSYKFQKTGDRTRRNISFLGHAFQYDEISDGIVYLNEFINI